MQAFLGAINYYSRFIQNIAVYGAALYRLKEGDFLSEAKQVGERAELTMLQQQIVKATVLRHFGSTADVHVMVFANEWALSTTLMQMHDVILHPVWYCGRVLKEGETNYHPAEREVLALLQLLKITHTVIAGKVTTPTLDFRRWSGSSRLKLWTEEPSASLYYSPRII